MKAHVELLSGVVRVGPETDHYGAPYEYAVAFSSTDGRTAVIKALTGDGGVTVAHSRAAFKALKAMGLQSTWERIR